MESLYGSLLFDDVLVDRAPEASFVVNGKTYNKGYYLADGIYPTWATLVKTYSISRDEKTMKFKKVQESARKDIERAFGVLQVDFSNAFNLVDRSALLHEQGDLLGPLLFALVLHLLVHKIRDNCKLLLHAWYLDDETVIGDSEEVARVLNIIRVSGPCLGLELNINNT
ncbi:putative reverse transcriptase domain-containing protein [Tanacetum coccineum]